MANLRETIEKHPLFPRKTNVEFVRCLSSNAEVKVWEREQDRLWPAVPEHVQCW